MRPSAVIVIGAGGHGQVVADILQLSFDQNVSNLKPVGFVDDDTTLHGQTVLGLPMLGKIAELAQFPHDFVIMGIGSNTVRARLFNKLQQQGEAFCTAVHPNAIIGSAVTIGPGTAVCAGVVVNTCTTIGHNVILNTACSVDHHNQIASHGHIGPGARLGGDVVVGQGTLVGIGAIIKPQTTIGTWSIVGAGSCVLRDVSDNVTIVGTPAQQITKEKTL